MDEEFEGCCETARDEPNEAVLEESQERVQSHHSSDGGQAVSCGSQAAGSGCKGGEGGEEDTPHSRAACSAQALDINPFGFEARTSYNATEDLLNTRSANYRFRPPPPDNNIWKRPPPDFRPQVYAPKPPKRNSRDAVKPWKYGTKPGEKEEVTREESVKLPLILQAKSQDENPFVTHFNILDPYQAKILGAKYGSYKPGAYKMPQPHDFRGVRTRTMAVACIYITG